MKQEEIKYIKEMQEMQAKLDAKVEEVHQCTIEREKLDMALVDEIGELTHELKYEWCWWKKTQEPIDKSKVLEELIDVLHFALSFENHFDAQIYLLVDRFAERVEMLKRCIGSQGLAQVFSHLIKSNTKAETTIAIGEYLGFTIEEMYEAYKKKNKENYARLERGY